MLKPIDEIKIDEGVKEIPDLIRLKLKEKQFMMMSWLVANTIQDDQAPEFKKLEDELIERLCQAHNQIL